MASAAATATTQGLCNTVDTAATFCCQQCNLLGYDYVLLVHELLCCEGDLTLQ
jgi:hypothetical protein